MTQKSLAVYEHGMLKLLDPVSLTEQQKVQVEITSVNDNVSETLVDPLDAIEVDTGIPDLAEHFDDYRFGLKQP